MDITTVIQTKAEFYCTMTVMDNVCAWHEKERTTHVGEPENCDVDGKLAVCTRIYTKSRDVQWSKKHRSIQRPEGELCDRSNQLVMQQCVAQHRIGF